MILPGREPISCQLGSHQARHANFRTVPVQDHVEVGRLARELGTLREVVDREGLSDERQAALRRVLYGLYTLVKVHFAEEEEIYLPLLEERLPASEAEELLTELAHSSHRQ